MCKFSDDWLPIVWPEDLSIFESRPVLRVQSIYDVYCNKCNKFVNLLDGKEIDPDGRIIYKG